MTKTLAVKTITYVFHPQDTPKRFTLKERRLAGHSQNYNFRARIKWYPAGWKLNKQTIGNQFSRLHYLACHSPKPIAKKWSQAYNAFYKKHFGVHKGASARYLNNWSCHSWL